MHDAYRLDQLPDDVLLTSLKRLTGTSNELTAQLLAHLAEVEARGIHRTMACASLYTYCVYELRLSEDEAQRRCRAARACRQFPQLFAMLAEASIHLTGILLLAPHLTDDNEGELLARARFRTKREIEKLVAEVAPRADAPARIEPLHVAGPPGGGHALMMAALCGPVQLRKRKYVARAGADRSALPDAHIGSNERRPVQSPAVEVEMVEKRTRRPSAPMARAIWDRDVGRCSYVDIRGERCRETSLLEYHHILAFALGGATTLDNLTLRCRSHNALAAEQDFGRAHVARARCGESDCTSPT